MDGDRRFRLALLSALVALLLQFLLGMMTNLFVEVPLRHPGASPPEYFSGVARGVAWAIFQSGDLWLVAHTVWGLLILASSLRVLVDGLRRGRGVATCSILGSVFILFAGFNGGSFLNYHEDFSSMIMAGFFAAAIFVYALALYLESNRPALRGA